MTGDLQDGMLAYYLSQAQASDVNVEARLDREPFDYRLISTTAICVTEHPLATSSICYISEAEAMRAIPQLFPTIKNKKCKT